ncbi:hypothetical protein [Acidisarcina polymorpha]|uniref:hypothetical protein n=1 Tax=Acidisarcina polymorpha TaxID=2211140 RepID=UPI00123834D6|nr:hypothetical protein [Acidisarcina polymorpha]
MEKLIDIYGRMLHFIAEPDRLSPLIEEANKTVTATLRVMVYSIRPKQSYLPKYQHLYAHLPVDGPHSRAHEELPCTASHADLKDPKVTQPSFCFEGVSLAHPSATSELNNH